MREICWIIWDAQTCKFMLNEIIQIEKEKCDLMYMENLKISKQRKGRGYYKSVQKKCVVSWLAFTRYYPSSHPGREASAWICPYQIAYRKFCRILSWLMIDVRESVLLKVVPSLRKWSWMIQLEVKQPTSSKPLSSVPPQSLPKFLRSRSYSALTFLNDGLWWGCRS